MIITILSWSGALLSCLLTIPQVVRTLRSDRLDGISAATYWIVLGNALVWAAWAVLAGQYTAGVPALVNGPAAMLILRRLHRIHKPARSALRTPDRPFLRWIGPPDRDGVIYRDADTLARSAVVRPDREACVHAVARRTPMRGIARCCPTTSAG
jgi:uncharacterized protein with PQ loop repeat